MFLQLTVFKQVRLLFHIALDDFHIMFLEVSLNRRILKIYLLFSHYFEVW